MKRITPAEERRLAILAKAGDREALGALLAAHEGHLRKLARGEVGDIEDKLQNAKMLAIESLATFDPDRGIRFMTYAARAIKWRMIRDRASVGLVRVPHYQNYQKINAELKGKADRARVICSIDAPAPSGDPGLSVILRAGGDFIERVVLREQLESLHRHFKRLPDRDRRVLLDRMNDVTLEEIAQKIGVTRQRVRQLEKRAFERLREMMLLELTVKSRRKTQRAKC